MKISDVRVRIVKTDKSKIKASASITIDDCIVVHDIKIINGEKGLFVSMPSRKTPDGEYKDIVHPINTETREILVKAIFDAYEKALAEAPVEEVAPETPEVAPETQEGKVCPNCGAAVDGKFWEALFVALFWPLGLIYLFLSLFYGVGKYL